MTIEPIAPDGSFRIRPIGFIHSAVAEQQTGGFEETLSEIRLKPEFAEYLMGLEEYSHVTVLYWLGEQTESLAATRPQGHPEAPYVGMFACR